MFNKFMIVLLLSAAVPAMSFSTLPVNTVKPVDGKTSTLTVTNPSTGVASMSWTFSDLVILYTYWVVDANTNAVVRSGQTTQTSQIVKGLQAGTYHFFVSNGIEVAVQNNVPIL